MTLDGTNATSSTAARRLDRHRSGPDDPAHIAAFVTAAHDAGARFEAILVTHDIRPLSGAAPLAEATGAPVYAHTAATFPHDRTLADGERVTAGAVALIALDTPDMRAITSVRTRRRTRAFYGRCDHRHRHGCDRAAERRHARIPANAAPCATATATHP